MNGATLNFDLYAMAQPKNRNDLIALAHEVLAELSMIDRHLDRAIERCEASATA
ncbi:MULTISPECIES: hypothetical protein [Xanthomonas]|jgi:hypothetical protein|uniref:hypothetical protein n=1 Tax=Xanthomonas TaxID=338 RepID=UPI00158C032B|nr:hypothetical protein [Xanthomonas campestris]MCC5094464.1 hypothetical protein [Xanthomonas campestris pv. incanae]MEA9488681.1 hypothetical protein [Xanthomonas campestris]MEA9507358.1 hypothetical protein [Xanthomonas campestris]MEA9574827.1 hypothetical protein [Xanthomonas campestris]MEA9605879.1 hypothetical protein [Xanthomonas campestris pv. plantaginis]